MGSSQCTPSDLHGPCDACKDREDAEAQILDAKNRLAVLKVERIAYKTAQNASHDLLVGKLPSDIVSRIFKVYVDLHYENEDFPFFSIQMRGAPLHLGAVCHAWRTIAWGLPCLWTTMTFGISPDIQRANIFELALQWLGRTGQLPLSICLHQNGLSRYGDKSIGKAVHKSRRSVIHALCAVSSRWETLDIFISESDANIISQYWPSVCEGWRPGGNDEDSSLRHLRLQGLSPKFTAKILQRFRMPPLLGVTFNHIEISPNLHNFNWSNLVAFDVYHLSWRRCLLVMHQAAPCLREFTSRFIPSDSRSHLHIPTHIVCPELHSLILLKNRNPILDSLTLPSLKKLHYGTSQYQTEDTSETKVVDSLLSLIGRSHCQLTSLQLSVPDLSLRRCLLIMHQVAPCLQEFSLETILSESRNDLHQPPTYIECPALHSLILLEDHNSILDFLTLPSLKKLHYSRYETKDTKVIDSLLSLIRRSHCQLTSLSLSIPDPADQFGRLLRVTTSLESLSLPKYSSYAKAILTYLSTTSSDGSEYLPHLKELSTLYLEPTFPWTILLDIYDPSGSYTGQGSASETPNGLQRQFLKLDLYVEGGWYKDPGIDKISLHRISNLIDQGIKLSIKYYAGDFIACSYKKLEKIQK